MGRLRFLVVAELLVGRVARARPRHRLALTFGRPERIIQCVNATPLDARKLSWPLLLVVFVLLPGAAVWGDTAIFHLYGDGHYLPYGSAGEHALHWWDGVGRPLCVGVAAFLLLLAFRVRPPIAAGYAVAAAAVSYVWLFAVVFVALWLAGPNALN
jgi:hypothetical protein